MNIVKYFNLYYFRMEQIIFFIKMLYIASDGVVPLPFNVDGYYTRVSDLWVYFPSLGKDIYRNHMTLSVWEY